MLKLINGVLGAICFVILGSDVLAATHDFELRREAAAATHEIGLGEAVSIAESRVNGHAVDAKLIDFGGNESWDVDVASANGHLQVWVDAHSGAVGITQAHGTR